MTSPCGKIRIPINESSDDKSQIEEFIREYRGEGIQHIALSTNDIYATVEALRARGVKFMDTPETYYARVDARVPGHGESLARLQALNILIDGAPVEGILLRSAEHTSELQSLLRISFAVFCLKKKKQTYEHQFVM